MSRSTGSLSGRPSGVGRSVRRAARSLLQAAPSVRSLRGVTARVGPRTALAAAVLAPVAAATVLRVADAAPGALPAALAAIHGWLAAAGPTAVAGLVLVLGVAHRAAWPRAGLVVAGVFGLLGLHVPAAAGPAVAGVVGGAALPVAGRAVAGEPGDHSTGAGRPPAVPGRRLAVAGVLWLGLALSLASATGLVAAATRPAASTVALSGVALVPAALAWSSGPGRAWPWLAGGLAAAAVLAAAGAAPFATGAAVLVGFGVVGAPTVAVAAAAGGGVAALAGAHARGDWRTALAAGLVLAAGVPATLATALPVAAAVALLAGGETG